MTEVLEKAFDEASNPSESEQNALGEWLLAEIESEREWDRAFARSQNPLASLATGLWRSAVEAKLTSSIRTTPA